MRAAIPVLVIAVSVATLSATEAATLHVPADFATVQAAVDAATGGDRVIVSGGPYVEQVTVAKSLTLAGMPGAVIKAPPAMTASKAIVLVTGSSTSATIETLTITGPGGGNCHSLEYGIQVDGGARAEIRRNDILAIRDEPFGGCQNGIGILIGNDSAATTGTANIRESRIAGFQKGAINIRNAGSTATVEHNEITGIGPTNVIAQNGIRIISGATAWVRHNVIRNLRYTPQTFAASGLVPQLSGPGTELAHNLVDATDVGIFVIADQAVVEHNTVTHSTFDGIALLHADGNRIAYNHSEGNGTGGPGFGSGIGLFDSNSNVVANNHARANSGPGFFTDETSTGNTFQGNHATGNGILGFWDVSVGGGTAGTANTYWENQARDNPFGDSFPAGLAK